MHWLGRAVAAVVLAAGLALAIPAAAAQAQTAEWVRSYAVDLRIEAGGTLLVSERIDCLLTELAAA